MEINLLLLLGIGCVSLVAGWQSLSVGFLAYPVLIFFLPDLFTQIQPYALVLSSGTALIFLIISRKDLNFDLRKTFILGGNAALAASFVAFWSNILVDHGCTIVFIYAYSILIFYGVLILTPKSTVDHDDRFWMVFSATAVTSLFSGLLGVGTGYILLPILVSSGIKLKQGIAISAFVELLASMFALLPRLTIAQWNINLLILLMGTGSVGTILGIYLSKHFPLTRKVRIILYVGICGLVFFAGREVIKVCPTFDSIG